MSEQTEEVDKRQIYQDERKWFIEWLKTVCEQPFQNVKTLAEQYVAEGKVSSMKALIAELSDGEGHKSIHFAVSRNHLDTTAWFLDEDPDSISVIDEDGYSPLCHAVINDLADMVELLLQRGADVNQADGVPALDVAIDQNNPRMVNLLLSHGADVNISSPMSNGLPIHHACAHNSTNLVRLLLAHDVHVNERNGEGITPLLYAAVNTNSVVIQLLLDKGADPLLTLPEGETALHIVAECGHLPSVECFLKHPEAKQIVNAKDKKGYVPAVYAAQSSQLEVLQQLLPLTEGCENMTIEEAMMKLVPEEPEAEESKEPEPAQSEPEVRVLSAMDKEIVARKDKEGTALFKQEKFQEALDVFSAALEIDPENAVLHSNRSSCYLRLGNEEKAMEDAEACIRIKPNWAKGYYRKGMVFFHQERYIDSAEAFYHGCELNPEDTRMSEMYKESITKGKEQYQQHHLKE